MKNAQRLPRIEAAGLDGWMVRLFEHIDDSNLPWLTALSHDCEDAFGSALVDLVPSYTTLLVVFDPAQLAPKAARQTLIQLLTNLSPQENAIEGRLHEIPTWYDESVGPDVKRVAALSGLSTEQVIERHVQQTYRVFALGFAPGFAFMGLLDPALHCPRLDTPRQRVPAGSVAIAGQQTAAYPSVTPGGWNLIGRTAVRLFDRQREGFSLLRVGDRVRFVSIDRARFEADGGDTTPLKAAPSQQEARR